MNRFDQMTAVTIGEAEEARRLFMRWACAEVANDSGKVVAHWNAAMRMEPAPRAMFEYMTGAWTDHRVWGHDPDGLECARQRRTVAAGGASEVQQDAEQLAQEMALPALAVRMAVARALFGSDSAALMADGIEPSTWSDLDDENGYMQLATGLVDSGVIAWPPATPAAVFDAAAVDALGRWIHEDVEIAGWPAWADLPEHSRAANREYVRQLDAAGLLDHTAAAEVASLELTEEEN